MGAKRFIPFSSTTGSARSVALRLDCLDPRIAPVVGAFSDAPLVNPGSVYDGVALLQPMTADGGTSTATGTLLDSGLYLITAGHVLKDTDGSIPSDHTEVTFRLNDGGQNRNITIKVPSAAYKVNSGFNGDVTRGGDVALLPLSDQVTPAADRLMIAPHGADRHSLYTGSDELGKSFTMVGYGRRGTGYSGGIEGTSGQKRSGRNTFDSDASKLSQAPFSADAPAPGIALAWDFDNGLAANDPFGRLYGIRNTGLGAPEANPAQGDSGGPLFIGDKIAGIISYSDGGMTPPDFNSVIDRGFGEFGVATRISAMQKSLATMMAGKKNIVLDMAYQLAGADQRTENLTVSVRKVGKGEVSISVAGSARSAINGEYYRGKIDTLSGLTLRGSDDNERFQIDPGIGLPITVTGGAGGNSIASLDASGRWTISGTNSGANGPIRFSQIQNILGSQGQDVFRFTPAGRLTGKIDGEFLTPTRKTGGADYLDYTAMTGPVTVNLQTHAATRLGAGVFNVPHVLGSATGGDRLIGSDAGSILITRGTGNFLQAGAGDSFLVAGPGVSTVRGGAGDDLLIAGRLTLDSSIASLDRLFDAWRDDKTPFEQRANILQYGLSPTDKSSPKLSRDKTILLSRSVQPGPRVGLGKIVNSTLTGNAGRDWFWTSTASLITDRKPGEFLNGQPPVKVW